MTGISQTMTARLLAPVLDRLRMALAQASGAHLMSRGLMEGPGASLAFSE